ncbi:HD-like signal output (HDOD) protein [Sulfuritortus calidifontis]|uniref:HD-like signal output (HDOD) protein n=1 Tax=Sulfuritortus calidifontis TaxID=1914471 RepID=A0A4R3JXB3_9PROT|nr:HDOD domain-containing protein [Sulfuritortus calidifontis]TCS73040.1 HD-like signal output (HDOD) protein [Sulfuritortus calidifontis]
MPDKTAPAINPDSILIPSPPSLLIELEKLIDADEINIQAVAELISKDAGITAQIFRQLASPIYGLSKPPESLGKAVSLIGLKTLHDLVKTICLRQVLSGDSPFFEWFWERSAEISKLAAAVAWAQRTVVNVLPEHAYLVGLFHDCGIPVLTLHNKQYSDAFRQGGAYHWPDIRKEDGKFQTDHTVVGYLVAKHWKLPDYVCQAVRHHHEIINAEHKAATLVALLQMAIHIYNIRNGQDDSEWEGERERVLDELGILPNELQEFEEDIYDQVQQNK